MRRAVKLDPFDKGIERQRSKYVPASAEKRRAIAAILGRDRKTKNVSIRIGEGDLARLKERAAEEGVPYQTPISSVLHKYVADRLVDEKHILKSLELLGKR
jgi:predicted DNA binding CopG/RHH family protein